jgi:heme/copper-type cytochrome/quinol oxidase subunit 3
LKKGEPAGSPFCLLFFAVTKVPPTPDPAAFPNRLFSHHVPVWWSNTLVLLIEGAAFATLVVTYFYIRRNIDPWPPTGILPDLGISTINVAVLVIGILPMWYVVHLGMRPEKSRAPGYGLIVCVAFGLAATILRVMEFRTVHATWGGNAYGAIVWSILAVHMAHILAATLETLVLGFLMLRGPADEKLFADVRVNAVYWYFVALSWAALYTIVVLTPRFL